MKSNTEKKIEEQPVRTLFMVDKQLVAESISPIEKAQSIAESRARLDNCVADMLSAFDENCIDTLARKYTGTYFFNKDQYYYFLFRNKAAYMQDEPGDFDRILEARKKL